MYIVEFFFKTVHNSNHFRKKNKLNSFINISPFLFIVISITTYFICLYLIEPSFNSSPFNLSEFEGAHLKANQSASLKTS